MYANRLLAAAIFAAPMLIAGCSGGDAEQAVERAAGVEPGTNTRTADVDQKEYIVTETKQVTDAQTGEVVGKEVSTTGVTVQEEVKVESSVDVDSGKTTTTSEGFVPPGDSDNN